MTNSVAARVDRLAAEIALACERLVRLGVDYGIASFPYQFIGRNLEGQATM